MKKHLSKDAVDEQWRLKMAPLLSYDDIDEVVSSLPDAQWLILRLSKLDRSFRIYEMGIGTFRITTNSTFCPCCKRPFGA